MTDEGSGNSRLHTKGGKRKTKSRERETDRKLGVEVNSREGRRGPQVPGSVELRKLRIGAKGPVSSMEDKRGLKISGEILGKRLQKVWAR